MATNTIWAETLTNTGNCTYTLSSHSLDAELDKFNSKEEFDEYVEAYYERKHEKELNEKLSKVSEIGSIDFQDDGKLTVICWKDGIKTFVRCADDDDIDIEKSIAMGIAKRHLGNRYRYIEEIRYWEDKFNRKQERKLFGKKKTKKCKCDCRSRLLEEVKSMSKDEFNDLIDNLNSIRK